MPNFTKHKLSVETSPFYLGMELETTQGSSINPQTTQSKVYKLNKDGFNVSVGFDGGGIELQFPPVSLGFLHQNQDIFLRYVDLLQVSNYKEGGTYAGIHIHVDKTALTPDQFIAMVKFLSKNVELTRLIARRPPNHNYYGCSKTVNFVDHKDYIDSYKTAYRSTSTGSLSFGTLVVNRKGYPTIEFRIFQSTLNPVIIFANFEFIHSLVSLFQILETTKLDDYVKYVVSNHQLYPHLIILLRHLGITLPNFTEDVIVSKECEIAKAYLSKKRKSTKFTKVLEDMSTSAVKLEKILNKKAPIHVVLDTIDYDSDESDEYVEPNYDEDEDYDYVDNDF